MGGEGSCLTVEKLADLYLERLYRFALRLTGSKADAEDLVQETFLVATEKLHQLRDPSTALAWLLTILRRIRAKRPRTLPSIETASIDAILDAGPAEGIVEEVDADQLALVLAQMPEDFREPLLLFYQDELKYREIADIVGCPLGTVMSRIARGKAYLRSRLLPASVERD